MCERNDRIIFCTCAMEEDLPEEYWMLHRFVDGKNEFILGSPRMPVQLTLAYEDMDMLLCKRLNELDCFDKPIVFEAKDVLVIYLDGFEKDFVYEFNDGEWKSSPDIDSYELARAYDELNTGCINENWKKSTEISTIIINRFTEM